MPIATHLLIGHNLPYQSMHGNWHRLAKMATKRNSQQAAMQVAWYHPLSLVDNIKFISLTILDILTRD
jgi:hypothetical protein